MPVEKNAEWIIARINSDADPSKIQKPYFGNENTAANEFFLCKKELTIAAILIALSLIRCEL